MKALDTNILVRFLVRDDTRQANVVYKTFREAESNGGVFLVPLLVVLELIWVLESVYDVDRADLVRALEDLLLLPILEFESRDALVDLLTHAPNTKLDLPDLLIALSAFRSGCESVLTFDRKAATSEWFDRPN